MLVQVCPHVDVLEAIPPVAALSLVTGFVPKGDLKHTRKAVLSTDKTNVHKTPFYERMVGVERGIRSHKILSRGHLHFDYVLCITKNVESRDSEPVQNETTVVFSQGPHHRAQAPNQSPRVTPSSSSLTYHHVLLICSLHVSGIRVLLPTPTVTL